MHRLAAIVLILCLIRTGDPSDAPRSSLANVSPFDGPIYEPSDGLKDHLNGQFEDSAAIMTRYRCDGDSLKQLTVQGVSWGWGNLTKDMLGGDKFERTITFTKVALSAIPAYNSMVNIEITGQGTTQKDQPITVQCAVSRALTGQNVDILNDGSKQIINLSNHQHEQQVQQQPLQPSSCFGLKPGALTRSDSSTFTLNGNDLLRPGQPCSWLGQLLFSFTFKQGDEVLGGLALAAPVIVDDGPTVENFATLLQVRDFNFSQASLSGTHLAWANVPMGREEDRAIKVTGMSITDEQQSANFISRLTVDVNISEADKKQQLLVSLTISQWDQDSLSWRQTHAQNPATLCKRNLRLGTEIRTIFEFIGLTEQLFGGNCGAKIKNATYELTGKPFETDPQQSCSIQSGFARVQLQFFFKEKLIGGADIIRLFTAEAPLDDDMTIVDFASWKLKKEEDDTSSLYFADGEDPGTDEMEPLLPGAADAEQPLG